MLDPFDFNEEYRVSDIVSSITLSQKKTSKDMRLLKIWMK